MRFATLQLIAFGPFSRAALELDAERSHFHLIYGPNEAGKSTALRAITGLLFGIPVNSSDDHLHRKKDLRIGARLGNDKQMIELVRRKGRLRTLTDPADNVLDEQVLTTFLGGVDERLFTTLFGLDHERLRSGAHALLEGAGEVGESLFSAGGGGSHVGAVLGALRKEAEALFTPRGRGGKVVNHLLQEVSELRRKVAQEITEPAGYQRQKAALDEAEVERVNLRERIRELYTEQSKLSRVRAVLPWLAKRNELLRQLSEIGDVPLLPRDAGERRQAAERQLELALVESARMVAEIERGRARLSTLRIPEGILRISESTIEVLQNRLGRHRAAEQDEPKLLDKQRAAEQEVIALGASITPGFSLPKLERLRPGAALLSKVKRLSREHDQLDIEHKLALSTSEEQALKVAKVERALAESHAGMDVTAIRGVLSRSRGADEIEKRRALLAREIEQLYVELESGIKNLGLWSGTVDDFAALHPPSEAVIQRAVQDRLSLEQSLQALTKRLGEIGEKQAEVTREVELVCAEGSPPSVEELNHARSERDRSWAKIKTLSPSAEQAEIQALWSEHEAWLHKADAIADRLWREAGRVTRLANLNAERSALESALARAEEERASLLEQTRLRSEGFSKCWRAIGIEPLAPEYMVGWVRRRTELLELLEARRERKAENDELCDREAGLRSACIAACQQLGIEAVEHEPLSLLVDKLESVAEQRANERMRHEQLRDARVALLSEHEQSLRHLKQLEARLDAWRGEWQESLQALPVAKDLKPTEALDVLARLEQLFARVDGLRQIEQRVAGIARDRQQFSADVAKLAAEYYPEGYDAKVADRACGDLADTLIQAFRNGSAAANERSRILGDISQSEQALAETMLTRKEATRVLEGLMRAAGVDDAGKLESVEVKVKLAEQLRQDLGHAERLLLELGGGASIRELADEAEGSDVDTIPARLSEIQLEIEDRGQDLEALTSSIASMELGIKRLDVGAATAAEDLEAALAKLRDTTHHYLRVQMAVLALEREIEVYREQNQGPIVKRASEIFTRLTLGHYLGLQVGLDDSEKQVLMCKREDGSKLQVTSLSDGTRDQLYLALRLASLERFAEQREPLPLVLDDILIHFDDERASAALEVLAEYSKCGQVLFFTHHARLVELARTRLTPSALVVHELPASHASLSTMQGSAG